MHIKTVTKNGTPVPYAPEEAAIPAVKLGVATKNDSEYVYWLKEKSVKIDSFSSHPKDKGEYGAFAEGTCLIGKTRIKDDRFFMEKPYSFKLQFCSCKDEIGAPHLKAESFEMTELDSDPSKNVGEVEERFGAMDVKAVPEAGGRQYVPKE